MSTNQKPEFLLSLDPEEFWDPDPGEGSGSRNADALFFFMNRWFLHDGVLLTSDQRRLFDEMNHKRSTEGSREGSGTRSSSGGAPRVVWSRQAYR